MDDGTAWRWVLDWGVVRDDLIVGACPMAPEDIDSIRAGTDATAILSVQTDLCRDAFAIDYPAHVRRARALGLVPVNVPMRDFDPPDQRRRLPHAVAALARLLSLGHRIYVHCTAGINRSPLTILAYLSFVERWSTDEALAAILAARPGAEPYWEAYHGARADLVDAHRDAIAMTAWSLSQAQPERAAEANWYDAERRVIAAVLSGRDVGTRRRHDPHRS